MKKSFILGVSVLRGAPIVELISGGRALLSLSVIDFGGGVTFSFLRVLSLEKVAEVLEPVKLNGIVNGSHAVLVRTQGTHTLA